MGSRLLNVSSRIVESTGARMFGLEEAEVMERRRYVGFVRREIDVRPLPYRRATSILMTYLVSSEHARRGRVRERRNTVATSFAHGHAASLVLRAIGG